MANDDVTESSAAENEKMETRMIEGRDYFFLFPDGDVGCVSFRNASFEKKLLEWGNFFLTRAEAEAARERVRAALKGESGGATAESAGTQLALQDAAEAEARTREERDKLREEVAELRGKIERLRNDLAYWRGDAEGQKQLADAMAKELDEVNENWGKRKRELEQLSRENAELAAKNVELREEAEWWRREAKKQELFADTLAKKNAWLTAKVAVADWRGGSGGNAASPLEGSGENEVPFPPVNEI